jgi:hypothetical protein
VDGPLGAKATNFNVVGTDTWWGIEDWIEEQELEAQVEWTFIAAYKRRRICLVLVRG